MPTAVRPGFFVLPLLTTAAHCCRPSPLHPPAGANSDISLADLRGQARAAAAKNAHPLAVSPDTWQEVGAGRLCVQEA